MFGPDGLRGLDTGKDPLDLPTPSPVSCRDGPYAYCGLSDGRNRPPEVVSPPPFPRPRLDKTPDHSQIYCWTHPLPVETLEAYPHPPPYLRHRRPPRGGGREWLNNGFRRELTPRPLDLSSRKLLP